MKIKTLLRNSGLFSDQSSSGISSIKSNSSSNVELEKSSESKNESSDDDDFDKLSWSNFKINFVSKSREASDSIIVMKFCHTLGHFLV